LCISVYKYLFPVFAYSLKTIDFDTPTDLNGGGVNSTSLLEELISCEFKFPLMDYQSWLY